MHSLSERRKAILMLDITALFWSTSGVLGETGMLGKPGLRSLADKQPDKTHQIQRPLNNPLRNRKESVFAQAKQ